MKTRSLFSWDGRLPTHKPAYAFFTATEAGTIWVRREGATEPIADCDPTDTEPTPYGTGQPLPVRYFRPAYALDAFDLEGRFLGEIDTADVSLPSPAVHARARRHGDDDDAERAGHDPGETLPAGAPRLRPVELQRTLAGPS